MKHVRVWTLLAAPAVLAFSLLMILSLQIAAPTINRSSAAGNCFLDDDNQVVVTKDGPCTDLEAALGSINTSSQATIFVNRGTYTISHQINLDNMNVVIEGNQSDSNTDIQIQMTSNVRLTNSVLSLSWVSVVGDSKSALFDVSENAKIKVFDSKLQNKSGTVVAAQQATEVFVENAYIGDSVTGITTDKTPSVIINNSQFVKNTDHVQVTQSNLTFTNNLLVQSANNAVSLIYPEKTTIEGVTIADSKKIGLYIYGDVPTKIDVSKTLFVQNGAALDSTLEVTGGDNNFWKNDVDQTNETLSHLNLDPKTGIFYCLLKGSPMILGNENFIGYPRFNSPLCTEE